MTNPTNSEHENQERAQDEGQNSPFELEGSDPSSDESAMKALQKHQEDAFDHSGAVFGLDNVDEPSELGTPGELGEGGTVDEIRDFPGDSPDKNADSDFSEAPLLLDLDEAKRIIETLLYVAHEPLRPRDISMVFRGVENVDVRVVRKIVAELIEEYSDRTIQIVEVADGYRMCTRLEFSPWVRRLLKQERRWRVSNAGLETLAIIAYKQPITKAEVEEIRRVDCGGVIHTLLERKLVRVLGRRDVIGRPIVYGTTPQFLQHFGFKSLADMPKPEEFDMQMGLGGEIPDGDIIPVEDDETEDGKSSLLDRESSIRAYANGHSNGSANGHGNGHSATVDKENELEVMATRGDLETENPEGEKEE